MYLDTIPVIFPSLRNQRIGPGICAKNQGNCCVKRTLKSKETGNDILTKVMFLLLLDVLIFVLQASFHTSYGKMKNKHILNERGELCSLTFELLHK